MLGFLINQLPHLLKELLLHRSTAANAGSASPMETGAVGPVGLLIITALTILCLISACKFGSLIYRIFPEFSWENSLLNDIQFRFYGPQTLYQSKSICYVSSRNSLAFQACWQCPFQAWPKTSLWNLFYCPMVCSGSAFFEFQVSLWVYPYFYLFFSVISVGSWKEKSKWIFLVRHLKLELLNCVLIIIYMLVYLQYKLYYFIFIYLPLTHRKYKTEVM